MMSFEKIISSEGFKDKQYFLLKKLRVFKTTKKYSITEKQRKVNDSITKY